MPFVTTYVTWEEFKRLKQITEENRIKVYKVMRALIKTAVADVEQTQLIVRKVYFPLADEQLEQPPNKKLQKLEQNITR